jgi:toxin-antitoxin system PIN domain toxin
VILIDTNVLLYAVNEDAVHHRPAKKWLEGVLTGPEAAGFAWNVLLAFVRLTTRPGLFQRPLPVVDALNVVAAWLDQDAAVVVHPGPNHFRILRDLLLAAGAGGNLTSDAHLAALAIEHGAVLCSLDRDFGRFPQLHWRNPLES